MICALLGTSVSFVWSLFADDMPAGHRRFATTFGISTGLAQTKPAHFGSKSHPLCVRAYLINPLVDAVEMRKNGFSKNKQVDLTDHASYKAFVLKFSVGSSSTRWRNIIFICLRILLLNFDPQYRVRHQTMRHCAM